MDDSFRIGSCKSNNRACQVTVKGRTTRLVANHRQLISALGQLENRIGKAPAIRAEEPRRPENTTPGKNAAHYFLSLGFRSPVDIQGTDWIVGLVGDFL
jgi:hypothetical protein